MKPAPFAYHRAHSVDEAVALLAGLGDEAKILAGGLSLVPTMNFRLAGLAVLPRTGHTANLEEPDVFNRAVDGFLAAVARGAWRSRDPRSLSASIMTSSS